MKQLLYLISCKLYGRGNKLNSYSMLIKTLLGVGVKKPFYAAHIGATRENEIKID